MTSAAVGFHCPQCYGEGVRSIPRTRTRLGGIAHANGRVVTWVLLSLNLVAFAAGKLTGEQATARLLMAGWLVPTEPWRLLTSAFAHVEWFHILANMFMLFQLGPMLEGLLGRLRFALLYLLSALGGSLAVWVLAPAVPTLGASGAVLGMVGALLVISRHLGGDITWILAYVAVTAVLSFTMVQISWQGHLGGFVTGLLIGLAYVQLGRRRQRIRAGSGTG